MKQNWKQLAAIQAGMIVGLPSVMVGHVLIGRVGLLGAMIAVIGGSIILCVLGAVSASLSFKHTLTTIEHAKVFFGRRGMLICSLAMGICLFGWFIIQLNLMTEGIVQLLGTIGVSHWALPILINFTFGNSIVFLVSQGIRSIGRFFAWNLPLMLFTLIYSVFSVYNDVPVIPSKGLVCSGIPLIVASNLAIVTDMPTYYRFARTYRDALISVCWTFLFVVPLVSCVGIALGMYAPELSLIGVITKAGGIFWTFWAASFLVASCGLINSSNIYSCNIAIKPLTSFFSDHQRLFLLGSVGSGLSCFQIVPKFEPLLEGITILLGCMAAVMLTNYCLDFFSLKNYGDSEQTGNVLSLMIGSLFGFLSFLIVPMRLTGSAFIDASLISMFSLLVFRKLKYGTLHAR